MSATTAKISRHTDRPDGATGVHWAPTDYTECFAVIDSPAVDEYETPEPGEFAFDQTMTGGGDCTCDQHAEYRRERDGTA